jgi:hypothetical protein
LSVRSEIDRRVAAGLGRRILGPFAIRRLISMFWCLQAAKRTCRSLRLVDVGFGPLPKPAPHPGFLRPDHPNHSTSEEWRDRASGETLKSCTIIVTERKSLRCPSSPVVGRLPRGFWGLRAGTGLGGGNRGRSVCRTSLLARRRRSPIQAYDERDELVRKAPAEVQGRAAAFRHCKF